MHMQSTVFVLNMFISAIGGATVTGQPEKEPETKLHPSWEASKKRKQQVAGVTAFCGKKIKFDDDS